MLIVRVTFTLSHQRLGDRVFYGINIKDILISIALLITLYQVIHTPSQAYSPPCNRFFLSSSLFYFPMVCSTGASVLFILTSSSSCTASAAATGAPLARSLVLRQTPSIPTASGASPLTKLYQKNLRLILVFEKQCTSQCSTLSSVSNCVEQNQANPTSCTWYGWTLVFSYS